MKRVICVSVMVLMLCVPAAMAANTVVIQDQNVAKGATGVIIPVLLSNDDNLKSVICPLVFREQTPGAFITSVALDFGDRLPVGGPLSEIGFRNQYADEDGICHDGEAGGFGTITLATGGPGAVGASPEGVLFVRQKLFSAALAPGSDATGSFLLTVDVTNVDGTFEIDTTCANPSNHLLFIEDVTNIPHIPEFTKGIITVGNPVSNQPPTALCQDVTVDADANCEATVDPAQVDAGSSDPDSDPITFALDPTGPYSVGATAVNLIVTDDSGDADTCQATITVVDNTPPVIACSGDVAVQCAGDIPDPSPGAFTASDNCPGVTAQFVDDVSDGQSCPETITRTYRATDAAGNTAECQQIITVMDTEAPVITACAGDVTVMCSDDVPAVDIGLVTATDNCGSVTITHVGDASDGQSCPETITRTYRATDDCGNFVECTQTITVNDTEPPVVTCSGDLDVTIGPGETEAIVNFSSTVSDNCAGATIACNPSSGSAFPVGQTTVTCTGTDACGNTDVCSFVVTVTVESIPPTALCQDVTVNADANCEADASVDAGSFDPDGGAVTLVQTPPGPYPLGPTNVVLTVTDDENDVTTCTAVVTVVDNTPPEITCNADINIEVGSGDGGSTVIYTTSATDNCGLASVDCDHASGDFFPVGATVVTCTAIDNAGNQAECSFTITITQVGGNAPPVAVDDHFGARSGVQLFVVGAGCLTNDNDPDGDPLTAVLDTDVSNGVLTLNADGSFFYKPSGSFVGIDQFTYYANDGSLNSATPGTVYLHVKMGGAIVLGDYDEDGFLTAIDMGKMIDALYAGGPDPHDAGCDTRPRGDFDGDGFTTSLDFANLVDYLFAGGHGPYNPCDE